jgi:hypothetical protein
MFGEPLEPTPFAVELMAHRREAAIRWVTFAVPACWN